VKQYPKCTNVVAGKQKRTRILNIEEPTTFGKLEETTSKHRGSNNSLKQILARNLLLWKRFFVQENTQ
jgi:hypothetical protein